MTTETAVAAFRKIVNPGTVQASSSRTGREVQAQVFCKIEWDGRKLSISGVEGPTSNGDCLGSCGQIDMGFRDGTRRLSAFSAGWRDATWADFLAAWGKWHLNDLTAGCEHQRENWDTTEKLEIVTYKLTMDAYRKRNAIKDAAQRKLETEGAASVTDSERELLALPWTRHDAPDADSAASGCYEVEKRETKAAGWVTEKEHPRGLLSKPCEVCGYKYGTKWLHREIPAQVLEFLQGLPDSTIKPAWV